MHRLDGDGVDARLGPAQLEQVFDQGLHASDLVPHPLAVGALVEERRRADQSGERCLQIVRDVGGERSLAVEPQAEVLGRARDAERDDGHLVTPLGQGAHLAVDGLVDRPRDPAQAARQAAGDQPADHDRSDGRRDAGDDERRAQLGPLPVDGRVGQLDRQHGLGLEPLGGPHEAPVVEGDDRLVVEGPGGWGRKHGRIQRRIGGQRAAECAPGEGEPQLPRSLVTQLITRAGERGVGEQGPRYQDQRDGEQRERDRRAGAQRLPQWHPRRDGGLRRRRGGPAGRRAHALSIR
nr:hypothetical protein [Frondihabitans sp. PAMC 28766]